MTVMTMMMMMMVMMMIEHQDGVSLHWLLRKTDQQTISQLVRYTPLKEGYQAITLESFRQGAGWEVEQPSSLTGSGTLNLLKKKNGQTDDDDPLTEAKRGT